MSRKILRKLEKNWRGLNRWEKILKVQYTRKWLIYSLQDFVKEFTGKPIENSKFYVFTFFCTIDNLRIKNSTNAIFDIFVSG